MPALVLTLFGTRPEVIKLAPVVRALDAVPGRFESRNVATGQHADLAHRMARVLGLRIDHDLGVGRVAQTPAEVIERVQEGLEPLIASRRPAALLVQGDTSSALAGALAGRAHGLLVGHVEAGLRTGNPESPFPEESNRRRIADLASLHFAATPRNRDSLIAEGVDPDSIHVTGNPIVDSLQWAMGRGKPTRDFVAFLAQIPQPRLMVLTTHRRESFGEVMFERLRVLKRFVAERPDIALVFPQHLNPATRFAAERELKDQPRVHLIEPLEYFDFIHLMARSWLIVTDSGGIQEEAPSLGKPVLLIRDTTERSEAIDAGFVRVVGESTRAFEAALLEADRPRSWIDDLCPAVNPFGRGDSGRRIANVLAKLI